MDVHAHSPLPVRFLDRQPPAPGLFRFARSRKGDAPKNGTNPRTSRARREPVQLSTAQRSFSVTGHKRNRDSEKADSESVKDEQPVQIAAAARAVPDSSETILTVAEKRRRLFERQREIYRAHRASRTQIDGCDSGFAPRHIDALWTRLYDEIRPGERPAFAVEEMLREDREYLAEKLARNETFLRWMEFTAHPFSCRARHHVGFATRNNAEFFSCPNASYYQRSTSSATDNCTCATRNTIMLCNDLSHQHSRIGWQAQIDATHTEDPLPRFFTFDTSVTSTDRYRDRLTCGSFNQNIVAANTFGPGTAERWEQLMNIAIDMSEPPHSITLFNRLDAYLSREPALSDLRHCIDCFSTKSPDVWKSGKSIDRRMSLPPRVIEYLKSRCRRFDSAHFEPRYVRDAGYLDATHPHHSRFDATDANSTTLALALFVEATGNSLWLRVWQAWCSMLERHCATCPHCCERLVEFLSCIVILAQLTPGVIEYSYAERLEVLLLRLKP